jgi:hypothetical protein
MPGRIRAIQVAYSCNSSYAITSMLQSLKQCSQRFLMMNS